MRRLLVNDALNQLGERTFWNDLQEWFKMEFIGGDYATLATVADSLAGGSGATLVVRNATYFPPLKTQVPTISLLQDIIPEGPVREVQGAVIKSSTAVVYNSPFTASKYENHAPDQKARFKRIIPLPVDFSLFAPQNAMGCQQALGLPSGCVCWIGASQGAAAHVKGWDTFRQVVRANPDIMFVAIFKDEVPADFPPNMRCFARLPQAELAKVIGACSVGLCTSRTESQHLAGIEMGACGLPLVVPPVGIYWQRKDWPGCEILEHTPAAFAQGIRSIIGKVSAMSKQVSEYWRKEFDKSVIRQQWAKLIEEVENAPRN
jgi:hypothetical protein